MEIPEPVKSHLKKYAWVECLIFGIVFGASFVWWFDSKRIDILNERISQLKEQKDPGSLFRSEKISVLSDGNTIFLDYEPIPDSVKIHIGPLTHLAREEYGYKIDGRRLIVVGLGALGQIKERLPAGGVTVEYLKKQSGM